MIISRAYCITLTHKNQYLFAFLPEKWYNDKGKELIALTRPRFSAGNAVRSNFVIVSEKLPESFSGFKIAHISDPHSVPAQGVCEEIAAAMPDICVITGDLLNDDEKSTEKVDKMIESLTKICPTYFISGNHDLWRADHKRIFAGYEAIGAKFLDRKCEILHKGDEKIALFGIPDPFSKIPGEIKRNVENAFSNAEDFDGYKILLFHRANLFDLIKDRGYDLILSGHMHGGQMRIPGLGGLLAPSSAILSGKSMLFPKYTAGVVTEGDATMIVNRGIGNTLPLPRWGNPCEVGIITLKKSL